MGYILSSFFIQFIPTVAKKHLEDYYKIKVKETTMERIVVQGWE